MLLLLAGLLVSALSAILLWGAIESTFFGE
jgi:hypothetical protein